MLKRTAALVADTGQAAIAWCHLNPEGDLITRLVPGAVQVAGDPPHTGNLGATLGR